MDIICFKMKKIRGPWGREFSAAAAALRTRKIVFGRVEGGFSIAQRPWPAKAGEVISNRIAGPAGAGGCLASCGACYHCLVAQQVMCQACVVVEQL